MHNLEVDFRTMHHAANLASTGHYGQTRWAGEPYINHVFRVTSLVMDCGIVKTDGVVAALLHDVVEDTSVTLADVSKKFGLQVAAYVDMLSQRKGEPRGDYFQRCFEQGDPTVYAIKFADRIDNLMGLQECPDHLRKEAYPERYLYEVKNFFFPHLDKVDRQLRYKLLTQVDYLNKTFGTSI